MQEAPENLTLMPGGVGCSLVSWLSATATWFPPQQTKRMGRVVPGIQISSTGRSLHAGM